MNTWSSFQEEKQYTDNWLAFLEEGWKEEAEFCDKADEKYKSGALTIDQFPVDRCGHPTAISTTDVEAYKAATNGKSIDFPSATPPAEVDSELPIDRSSDDESTKAAPEDAGSLEEEPVLNREENTLTRIHFMGVDDYPLESIHYPTDKAWEYYGWQEQYAWYEYYTEAIYERLRGDPIKYSWFGFTRANPSAEALSMPQLFRNWLTWEANNPDATPEVNVVCDGEECDIPEPPSPRLAQESLILESTKQRWQQLSGITPRVI